MIKTVAFYEAARRLLADFRKANSGNVAIIFGLAIIPLVGATGAALDYSRGSNARTALQGALDAAGLILSKEAQRLTTAQLLARAESVVKANLARTSKALVAATVSTEPVAVASV